MAENETIQEQALREVKEHTREKAVQRAKQIIHEIGESQRVIRAYQEKIEELKKQLSSIKVEEVAF